MAVQNSYVSDDLALRWASERLDFGSSDVVSAAPWARVHKLNGGGARAYLKQLAPRLMPSLQTTVALAERFAGELPDVISTDAELGLLMLKDPGGRRLKSDSEYTQHRKLLEAYAEIQGRARHLQDLLAQFPVLDVDDVVPSLLRFLDSTSPADVSGSKVTADYFVGRTRARDYHAAFAVRADLLQSFIRLAAQLPPTLNHCDLRLKNAAESRDRKIIISNWEHATVGPAGLSLHALFSGCAKVAALFRDQPAAARRIEDAAPISRALDIYVEALSGSGYASADVLHRALPAAVCAGLIQHLVWYADYPSDSRSYRRRVRRMLRSRFSDLLDLCDLLALDDPDATLRCAIDYRLKGRPRRAEALLRRRVAENPNDPAANAQLARSLQQRGKLEEALAIYRDAVELNPDDAGLHHDYGLALMEALRLDEAISALRRGIYLGKSTDSAVQNLDRASQLRRCELEADEPEAMPTLPVSPAELAAGRLQPESIALARKLFLQHGTLLIDRIFDEALVHACREHFVREYVDYLHQESRPDALPIGDKRYQITFAIEGPFNNPGIYANPIIMHLMEHLLGRKFSLGCTVCAASLPGSKDQHLHKDHRALFTRNADDPPMPTPPFAITTMVPLVPLDEMTGTTTVRKGSHLVSRRESADLPRQVPIVPVGSCFLMDLRLSHQGLGNKTDQVRPILNMVYQQPWFADNKNYHKQPPLRIPSAEYERIPEKLRKLFTWAVQPGPQVNR